MVKRAEPVSLCTLFSLMVKRAGIVSFCTLFSLLLSPGCWSSAGGAMAVDVSQLESEVFKQSRVLSDLQVKLQSQESRIQHQAALITDLQAQNSQLVTLQSRVSVLEAQQSAVTVKLNKEGVKAAFLADFGGPASFKNVSLHSDRPLLFNRAMLNEGSHYSLHQGTFTAPVNGVYSFWLHFLGSLHDTATELGIFVDDSLYSVAYAEGGSRDSNDQGSCTAVTALTAGQAVSVRFVSGAPVVWGSRLTSFSGMLVTPDLS